MNEYIQRNKEDFIALLRKTKKDGIEDLITWLEKRTDFFEAPASTEYHCSYIGGLCQHSLHVYTKLVYLNQKLELELQEDAMIITALLHDVCKANMYVKYQRNVQDDEGNWHKRDSFKIDEQFIYGHGSKSVLLVRNYIDLSVAEIMAIRYHMGAYEGYKDFKGLNDNYKKYKLAMYLHVADLTSSNEEIIEYD